MDGPRPGKAPTAIPMAAPVAKAAKPGNDSTTLRASMRTVIITPQHK